MSDNRTTELRKLLDERGVKWVAWEKECHLTLEGFFETRWDANGVRWSYLEINGKATLSVVGRMEIELTPDQAIAATLGRPKVKKVRGTWPRPDGGEYEGLACSGCGDWIDGDLDCIGEFDGPNFCHNCGGEFDGPLLCRVCGKLTDMEFDDMCAECYWHEGEGNDER